MKVPFSQIWVSPFSVKIDDDTKRQAIIDFATSAKDRQRDVLHIDGLRNLPEYLANPIVGYNHALWGGDTFPIGHAIEVDPKPERLRSVVVFDDDERSDLVYRKVKSGSLRTGSIGYDSVRTEYDSERDAYHIWEWNLYEQSIVTIPANPTAMVQAVKALGLELGELRGFATKGVIPYKKYPLDPEDAEWEATKEMREAQVEDLRAMCAWFDSEKPDAKGSYKLPHHRAENKHTVWRAVAAAMAALLGARGGVDIPADDRRGVYNHLAKHYEEFEKEPPEFKGGFDLAKPDIHLVAFKSDELYHHELSVIGERLTRFTADAATVDSLVKHHFKEGRVLSARNYELIEGAIQALQALLEAARRDDVDSEKWLEDLLQFKQTTDPIHFLLR